MLFLKIIKKLPESAVTVLSVNKCVLTSRVHASYIDSTM